MESMARWPLLKRNKVDASGIEEPVKKWAESDNERLKGLAQKVERTPMFGIIRVDVDACFLRSCSTSGLYSRPRTG